MDLEDRHLSRASLLAAAARAGCRLTPDRLKRWQRAGLVPRADDQVHIPGQAGSVSRYPPGTLRQVIEVCRRLEEEHRLAEVGLDLWWDGFWVEPSALRESLKATLDPRLRRFGR